LTDVFGYKKKKEERKAEDALEQPLNLSSHPSSSSLKDVLLVIRRIPEDVSLVSVAAES